MASNGSVVAESNREADQTRAGTAVSPTPTAPKPEVARKPQLPGNKPCPPLPKKPPVAHKPQSLSPNHGSPATAGTPVSPSSAKNSLSVSPGLGTSANTLSPPARPSTQGQGQGAAASPDGTAPQPVKTPPPPLPKNPPKGTSPAARRTKEPPPRPSPLPPAKKQPPPVPSKKPANRKPAVPQDASRDSSQLTGGCTSEEPSRSYDQVIVRENALERTHVKQPEGPELCSGESENSSTSRTNSYQQVIVEENSSKCAELKVHATNEKDSLSLPKSYENVVLKENSQRTSSSDLQRSYERVFVEENAQSESNVGVSGANNEPEGSDHKPVDSDIKSEGNDRVGPSHGAQILVGDAGGHTESQSSPAVDTAKTAESTEDQTGSEHLSGRESDKQLNDTENSASVGGKESLSLTDKHPLENKPREEQNVSNKLEGHTEGEVKAVPRKRPPKERPPRPSVLPPPVRPKPKKRISLLKQAQVSEEEPVQDHSSPSTADVPDCHSAPNSHTALPEAAGYPVEEALYQEIDELELPGKQLNERELPNSCASDRAPDAQTIKTGSDTIETGSAEKGSSPWPDQRKENEKCNQSDNAQDRCGKGNSSVVGEDFCEESETTPKPTCGERARDSEHASHQTTEKTEVGDQKDSLQASRNSPEKHESVSLEDVEETSFMLKEIEQLLKERLGPGHTVTEDDGKSDERTSVLTSSQSVDSPIRPPRPKRADKLRKLNIGSCSADSSSTESLTSVGLPGRKAPPKPKRKHIPGSVNRSLSDVTGMKSYVDQLNNNEQGDEEEEEEKPFLPPRQQSLRCNTGPKPPPLPPRNKPMDPSPQEKVIPDPPKTSEPEGKVKEGLQPLSTADRRSSAPNVGASAPTKMARSVSGAKPGKKHIPRPTRKAPPPPSHPPSRPLSMEPPESSVPSNESSGSSLEKVPGYQKIINGSMPSGDDINAVVPKNAVVGNIDSPSLSDVTSDNDYHEIPDDLVQELAQQLKEPAEKSKENTPPPDLPPRCYKPPPQPPVIAMSDEPSTVSDLSKKTSDSKRNSDAGNSQTDSSNAEAPESVLQAAGSETVTLNLQDRLLDQLSAEDSTSQSTSSQRSSRPESFSSEVLGSLLHVVGDHARPISTHSGSSHSETGSGEVEVPTFDHSSGSESENEGDEERMKQKREKKVYFIAEEVVKSEKVFVDVLKLLNVDFRVFMSSKTEQAGHPIVPAETLNKILDFLPQLQSFNEMLLKDLTDRIANWDKQKKIADIFVKKGPFLKLYSSYIRNFEHATALLDETCKKHNGFGMALQQFEMSPRCASLALKHYMLKPIQRIPQYKLLLQDYLKHLTPDCPDYKDTITALNIVSEVADHANESMRHGDNVQKLLEIQRSLIGQFEVIQPGRVLIRQGELMKLSRKEMHSRMFFLFSDVLLYTTPTATGYRLNNILPLQGMKVLPPKLEEFNNEFNIITTQRSFTVATNTPEEREEWLRALWNAIEENSERYHTFKAMQPEPKTSLLDKDFVLGTKAPLWVPDARVTMCMLCLAEFSITWRRHHCRACGRIICGNCSENKAPLRYLMYKPARVCDECFEKLAKEVEECLEKERTPQRDKSTTSPSSPSTTGTPHPGTPTAVSSTSSPEPSGLSFSSIKARFQKIRKSARERRKSGLARPSVLKEVHANDEGSDMSGYLWVAKNKKWKRLWFVVKGKVLYTYKASEDMAAIESMPLLGFEVTRMTSEDRDVLLPWYQGAEPDLMFELHHQNTQPLVFKPRNPSSSSSCSSERNSMIPAEDSQTTSPVTLSPHVKSSADTTTPRLIFRTDSAAATTKWLTVLREASLA